MTLKNINNKLIIKEKRFYLSQNKSIIIGFCIILFFIITSIFAQNICFYDPLEQDIDMRKIPPFQTAHILGTDDLGRDIFSRILFGGRISLTVGVISVAISIVFGGIIGLTAGYYGGVIDAVLIWFINILLSFPTILLTIVITAVLGPSLLNAMIAIGIAFVPYYARILRACVLAEKEEQYVQAERSLGASDIELMYKTILPNCIDPLIVQGTLSIGVAILTSATLSFIGLGAQPPTPEWGLMIASAKNYISSAWWIITFPGLAIFGSVLGFNLLGEGLRNLFNSQLK